LNLLNNIMWLKENTLSWYRLAKYLHYFLPYKE
jgi:hypothetical protein